MEFKAEKMMQTGEKKYSEKSCAVDIGSSTAGNPRQNDLKRGVTTKQLETSRDCAVDERKNETQNRREKITSSKVFRNHKTNGNKYNKS
jgi:hypothetical protein